ESRLLGMPRMEPLRKELLEAALTYYRKFVARHGSDPTVRYDLANALDRVGQIEELIGSKPEALTAYRQALDMRRRLVRDHPADLGYRRELGVNHLLVGTLLSETDQIGEAERYYKGGITILEPLAANESDPILLRNLGVSFNNLGILLFRTGRASEAEA